MKPVPPQDKILLLIAAVCIAIAIVSICGCVQGQFPVFVDGSSDSEIKLPVISAGDEQPSSPPIPVGEEQQLIETPQTPADRLINPQPAIKVSWLPPIADCASPPPRQREEQDEPKCQSVSQPSQTAEPALPLVVIFSAKSCAPCKVVIRELEAELKRLASAAPFHLLVIENEAIWPDWLSATPTLWWQTSEHPWHALRWTPGDGNPWRGPHDFIVRWKKSRRPK